MFNDIKEFYPTPHNLIRKMLEYVDYKKINTVLEPSAGKGNIIDKLKENFKIHSYNRNVLNIDTIEQDQNLQYILKGKEYRLIHDDFLTFNTYKKYDLIIMNPPFKNGCKHLLKALEIQEKGGQVICLLNAETLKNPYTNERKELLKKLNNLNANITYLENQFLDAEKTTGVEVALINVNIENKLFNSLILEELKQEQQYKKENATNENITHADFLLDIIAQYNYEIKAGIQLINEYENLKPYIYNSIKKEYKTPILKLTVESNTKTGNKINDYIEKVRYKYWSALFESKQFTEMFTSNLRYEFNSKLGELISYDFSMFNIQQIKKQLTQNMVKALEDTIINLFDDFSHKYYYDEMSKNIHMYNGWKTNKSYKINKKVIIPLNGFNWYHKNNADYDYKVRDRLTDIEKVFNYLDDGTTENISLEDTLKRNQALGITKKIKTKYFYITFYKKGTCHLEFRNLDLLHKFNVYGSQKKGWLPSSYANKKYNEMSEEEKQVINNFEGELSYKKVVRNKDYYIINTDNLLMLNA